MASKNGAAIRPRGARALTLNSFFSGIGGFELAFERKGFRAQFQCERDLFCRKVLTSHWPAVPIAPDIESLSPQDIPAADVWTAGFPCQDVSLAKVPHGRQGLKGAHSSLFFAFRNLVEQQRPRIILLENVPGLLNSHKGRDFGVILSALTTLGYGVAWRVLNARYFGVPQSRQRVFICAWMGDVTSALSVLYEPDPSPTVEPERRGFLIPSDCHTTGAIVPQVSYCVSATSGRHTGLDWARSYVSYQQAVRRLTPRECERLQGFPDDWTLVRDKVPSLSNYDTDRYRAIGNAIAVPVVEWIARRLWDRALKRSSSRTNKLTPDALPAEFRRRRTETVAGLNGAARKWLRGGCAVAAEAFHADVSTAPTAPIPSRFLDVVERQQVLRHYYLSPNAATGIIKRVERRGRVLFGPLHTALRRLASATHPDTAVLDVARPARRSRP